MTKIIASLTLNHVGKVNFNAKMGLVCPIMYVAMAIRSVGIHQMKQIVISTSPLGSWALSVTVAISFLYHLSVMKRLIVLMNLMSTVMKV